ncbi:MAG: hypothetical protein ACRDBP_03110, partial [Luteolibacter sp.]
GVGLGFMDGFGFESMGWVLAAAVTRMSVVRSGGFAVSKKAWVSGHGRKPMRSLGAGVAGATRQN